jgi:LmbE family N-acetylglucosaminyl deacetylase
MENGYKDTVVMAIGAHPDDIEFGCGGTMAKLATEGAKLYFVVATDGNRGSRQHEIEKSTLVTSRKQEQQSAAKILGATEVIFLDEEDGNLMADIHFKEKIVRLVRKIKPDMIFTHDPQWYFRQNDDGTASVNHNDHRACGVAVLDTVYPLARDLQSFPDHSVEGLMPHITPELYLWTFDQPGFAFDITDHIDTKISAIAAHQSQIDEPEKMADRMKVRHQILGKTQDMGYAECFIRLVFN